MTDPLYRRQRQAAAILLCSVDLPCEAMTWANLAIKAASVLPGAVMNDLHDINGGRRGGLTEARRLIDEMLQEIDKAQAEDRL